MPNEGGTWIMCGVEWDDAECIHTVDEAIEYINKIGFLPLFKNDILGFSLEERTVAEYWWSDKAELDPWKWREVIAAKSDIAYGKFFDKKAGFISKKWFPYFVNYKRDGYDFDALWDDELASIRQKKIMDLFDDDTELFSYEIKAKAGFQKGGEKNFEGIMSDLQMKTYLCVRNFQKRINKKGKEYGWDVAIYSKPEHLYGYDYTTSAYKEKPEDSKNRIYNYIREIYPIATEKQIKKIIK